MCIKFHDEKKKSLYTKLNKHINNKKSNKKNVSLLYQIKKSKSKVNLRK